MGLRVCLDERYESITCMVDYSADADFASVSAMPVVMLQDNDRLSFTLAGVLDIASVEVAVIAVVTTNWADAILLSQQLGP